MVADIYWYKYLIIDDTTETTIAEFEADVAPPRVGAICNLEDFSKSLNKSLAFQVVGISYNHWKPGDLASASKRLLVELNVITD